MKYLFWNTKQNKLINPILCDLVDENDISILVLAEYEADINELILLLRTRGILMVVVPMSNCDRVHILTIARLIIEPLHQSSHATTLLINNSLILCGVHLNSQIYSGNQEHREILIERIVGDICKYECMFNTKYSIIVGDFNINPYDHSCIDARYFHAMPIYEEASRKSRTIADKEYLMFYNPMWNLLGDFHRPYGTYYYNSSNTLNTYWYFYDQVIIRPDLRECFVNESLKILSKTSHTSLLDIKGHPDLSISDHLPLTFEIKESQYE